MRSEISFQEFSPIVREFASYKIAMQGCSRLTVEEYLMDLRTFFRYLLAEGDQALLNDPEAFSKIDVSGVDLDDLRRITKEQIYDFLLYTDSERGNQTAAKARKLSAIKGLYKFLINKRGLLEENPAANIDTPKKKKALPKFLSLEESISLLNAIANDVESKSRVRDYAIVTLFLNCGMRLSELVGISLTDIDPELRSMRVLGKGNKERIIYLNDACRAALAEHLKLRLSPEQNKAYDKALFLSNRMQRISVKTVQAMVYKYLEIAGLGARKLSVHKLRHTAATLMYQSGEVDIRVLKDILGHEQLNTTQIYTHVSDRHMEEAMHHNPLSDASLRPPLAKDTPPSEPSEPTDDT
ncbi:MAG: tyrosine-type recombinase/integrase [Clostridia bacterium]|nr:tyrosine-type recombinase/integrase [Clostridia bacterium]MBQ7316898.1 tyrosine-type recombinase/integrase [Clostridia bacterium]